MRIICFLFAIIKTIKDAFRETLRVYVRSREWEKIKFYNSFDKIRDMYEETWKFKLRKHTTGFIPTPEQIKLMEECQEGERELYHIHSRMGMRILE